jgi:sec-independent protein translocase protein TatA
MYRFLFLGGGEIMVVLLFVLLLFGSDKIPEAARMLGKALREFRRATEDIKREINNEANNITDDFKDMKKNLPDL